MNEFINLEVSIILSFISFLVVCVIIPLIKFRLRSSDLRIEKLETDIVDLKKNIFRTHQDLYSITKNIELQNIEIKTELKVILRKLGV